MSEIETFVETLVTAMLGKSIKDLPANQRAAMVQVCLDTFNNYIVNYIQIKYGDKDATRIKAAQTYSNSNVFNNFAELGPKFDEAYESFTDQLEQSWQK